jgi:hypothetical protein
MQIIKRQLIVDAFQEAILNDAKFVPSRDDDPNPNPPPDNSKDEIEVDVAEEESDDEELEQYEDDAIADLSEQEYELASELPSFRLPRRAQSNAYNAQAAQNMQYNISKS